MRIDAIMIKKQDNVATSFRDIRPNEKIAISVGDEIMEILVHQYIPYGHKFATKDILRGEYIVKYGEIMGRATLNIPSGTHAHIQNIESLRGRGDLESRKL
jgi:altronate dehydratase small subunit